MTRRMFWLLAGLFVGLLSRGANASEVFNTHIRTEFGYPATALLCTHCHATLIGGAGTVNKPFGLTAIRHGLFALNVEKLKEVLQKMETAGEDSDCDGSEDILELTNKTDPNLDDATMMLPADCGVGEAPRHGIYCSTAGGVVRGSGAFLAASAGALAGLLGARRRGRRALQELERQAR